MVWHDIFEDKRPYRFSKKGEIGQDRPKKWFNILGAVHVSSVIPTMVLYLQTGNVGILILHFPILFLIFMLSFTYGSYHVVYLDN